ncbi:MAG: STAS/SEC14 domain-containing protein [Acidobacteriota bacterium]|nr:STAS/SEC14 domain-containing protein [Acidobacteriota bacterium]
MIERLKESHGGVIGFQVIGRVTANEVEAFEEQIKFLIGQRHNRPIGIVADLSQMGGVDWKARWDEMRFLQKYTNHIARIAVVGADKWEEVAGMLVTGTALLQGETLYFHSSEILHAWHWARTSKHANEAPAPRHIYAATGIWKDYTPEFDI